MGHYCSCNRPSSEVESMEKQIISESKDRLNRAKVEAEAARRLELQDQLDEERKQFEMMKRAYDMIRTETDLSIENKETIRRLSQEKEQIEKQLMEDRQHTHKLNHEISSLKEHIHKMESDVIKMSTIAS